MSFSVGQRVTWRGTVAIVTSDEIIAGQEMLGVVPVSVIQYVAADQVNQPPPPVPPTPAGGPASGPVPPPGRPPGR